ncbi:uncharacterized protein CANTADRAFT_52054 [Suhomyces tanzawaensis NRRL Y-17324]|uniref:Uncharacterized protein n=1 Tax=Suhomyces tanzawaensis NRRL Y-17324 TaxID=984487 RepID=A0A1E4SIJ7_9ASCO|nr:uncharacterized protein CANTADRAFT_52054 [Suhomyces tanzawaensis NRRL Y-17324]ODV79318.1 hypothetical protein CANTADRAFT_52054 [Suhomyces tanzawaensis NRRL Y-17324]
MDVETNGPEQTNSTHLTNSKVTSPLANLPLERATTSRHSQEPSHTQEALTSPVPSVTMPFDSVYSYLQSQILPVSEPITPAQQSKFINYLDEELLKIQRKFIKDQADTIETYSLSQLQKELLVLIKLIWVSITKRNKLFGQADYLIKILGDLEDYLFHYKTIFVLQNQVPVISGTERSKLIQFFEFFQDIDSKLSLLMDGYEVGNTTEKLSSTQVVRLIPLASRLRIQIVSSLDTNRLALQRNFQASNAIEESRNLLDILDVEIGRLFEGVLERSEL